MAEGGGEHSARHGAHAVFVSYASEDSEAVDRICEALREAGIEVWFDRSELRGGDVWDQTIRQRIHDCQLFIPVVSAHTEARSEGYFRREWKLAVDRTEEMAGDVAFLVPVVIDGTPSATARVPPKFRDVQWTRLPNGTTSSAFVKHICRLLAPDTLASGRVGRHADLGATPMRRNDAALPSETRRPVALRFLPALIAAALLIVCAGYFAADRFVLSKRPTTEATAVIEKSIAVLPFADLSEAKDQQYFADGLAEELLDLLSKVPELRVPARTSSYYFRDKQVTIAEIARTLGVTHVLEGTVRRAGKTIRVTVQLIRADNGYHVWSKTYDRQLEDILKVQDDVAASVVGALKISLLGDRETRAPASVNGEAYTLFLLAREIRKHSNAPGDEAPAYAYLEKSLDLDPAFAPAWAELAIGIIADNAVFGSPPYAEVRVRAGQAVNRALSLDPALAPAHVALGRLRYSIDWNWDAGDAELKKAIELEPGNAEAYRVRTYVATTRGRYREAIELQRKATSLDPLAPSSYIAMGFPTYRIGDLDEAEASFRKAIDLNAMGGKVHFLLGSVLLVKGEPTEALTEMQREIDEGYRSCGVAMALDALGRHGEADQYLAAAESSVASDKAYWIAVVYAGRADLERAFAWLDRAYRQHDPGLLWMKGDPLIRGIVRDPRYKTLLRKMNLPE